MSEVTAVAGSPAASGVTVDCFSGRTSRSTGGVAARRPRRRRPGRP